MKTSSEESPVEPSVSASELSKMGRCERLVAFEHLHGRRRTKGRQRNQQRGLLAHDQFEREGLEAMAADAQRRGRYSIATRVFGEAAWQTRVLHQFRDEALRPGPWGRWLIRLYCRAAPGKCTAMRRWPVLLQPIRAALGSIAAGLRCWLGRPGEER